MKKEIFIIDDDKFYLGAMRIYFREKDEFEAHFFADPDEALKHLEIRPPFLIILDHQLANGKDGITYLQKIKTLEPNTPVIFMTGSREPALKHSALKAGAHGFIVKSPTSLTELNNLVINLSKPPKGILGRLMSKLT